jgi:hypothetical protein
MHPDRARGGKLRELCRRIKDSADAQALIRTAVYAVLARGIYVSVCAYAALRAIRRFASYMTSVNAAVDWSLAGLCVALQKEILTQKL